MASDLLSAGAGDAAHAVSLLMRLVSKFDLVADNGAEVLLALVADAELFEDLAAFQAANEDDEDDGTLEYDDRTAPRSQKIEQILDARKGHPVPEWSPPT